MYYNITNLTETDKLEKVNQLLQDDWILITFYETRNGVTYVLGKKRTTHQ